jgi:hypothetical protein
MKKTIIIPVAIILGLVVAIKSGALYALFMLFLIGIIPGTQIIIPANIMLLLTCGAMCAILFYSIAREIIHFIINRQAYTAQRTQKTHLPKQRFSEI